MRIWSLKMVGMPEVLYKTSIVSKPISPHEYDSILDTLESRLHRWGQEASRMYGISVLVQTERVGLNTMEAKIFIDGEDAGEGKYVVLYNRIEKPLRFNRIPKAIAGAVIKRAIA